MFCPCYLIIVKELSSAGEILLTTLRSYLKCKP